MEKIPEKISLKKKAGICLATSAVVLAIIALLLDRQPVQVPILVAPVTNVQLVDENDEPLVVGESRYAVAAAGAATTGGSGGSTSTPVVAAPAPTAVPSGPVPAEGGSPVPSPTPSAPSMSVTLRRGVPAITVSLPSAWDFTAWARESPDAKRFFDSPVFSGLVSEVLATLRVRPEDLSVKGFYGMTFEHFVGEILRANARVHYDRREGKRGFVLSFDRARASSVSKLLPLLVPAVAVKQFAVPSLERPIVELMIGSQTLLVAEEHGRVFISNGLKSLLRVLDAPRVETGDAPDAFAITVRAEEFLDTLLPLVTGHDEWAAKLVLAKGGSDPAKLQPSIELGAANAFVHLSPKLSPGLFAAVPRDVFAVAAGSFAIPPQWTAAEWKALGASGVSETPGPVPPEGGIALVWDLSGETEGDLSQIGLIATFSAPPTGMKIEDYFGTDGFHAECGGGTVWIASSSEMLFTRMKEACERQSTSFLTAIEKGEFDPALRDQQLFIGVNPGVALQACYLVGLRARKSDPELVLTGGSGGSNDDDSKSVPAVPTWKAAYEEAVLRITKQSTNIFRSLPEVVFSGKGNKDGVRLPGVLSASGMGE